MIFLYETGPVQWIFSQHYGYWWPGTSAPGHHPCGWKVRLQCIAVRKECALQTHLRILQRTPTHSHIFFCLKVRTPNALPGLHLQTKIHALQTHSWNFVFSKKLCTPYALLRLSLNIQSIQNPCSPYAHRNEDAVHVTLMRVTPLPIPTHNSARASH